MITTQLNRVEIVGTVGNCKVQNVCDTRIARLSVATNYAYRAKDGCPVIETTWHSVVCFEKDFRDEDMDSITKGTKVHLTGRIRNQRVVGEDGVDRTVTEIAVSHIEIVRQEECLGFEI